MSNNTSSHLHPIERAGALDSRIRRLIQNPNKILKKYIQPGMTVLDLGCGPGYFTIEMAKLLQGKGKIFATDVQPQMLDILKEKINKNGLQQLIHPVNNNEQSIGINEEVDFILAFYSFHEMKYLDSIITQLKDIIHADTKILIAEQKGHVSKYVFNTFIRKMQNNNFEIVEKPAIFLSRCVVMKKL